MIDGANNKDAVRQRLRPAEDELGELRQQREDMNTRVARLNSDIDLRIKRFALFLPCR